MFFNFQNHSDSDNNSGYSAFRLLSASELKSIKPDTNSADNKFENKHYKWFWNSDVQFTKYNTDIFGEVLRSYSNKTATSIQLLNQAVNLRESNIKHTNDTVKLNRKKT